MSDKNNSDNQNTNTIYIPKEAKERPQPKPLQRVPQQPQRTTSGQQNYSGGQQYQGNQQQRPTQVYQSQPYSNQPYQNGQQRPTQAYQGQPYSNQPYQNGQQQRPAQAYQGQQYSNQPYQGQQYSNQPYQGGQPYPNQQYAGQPYQNQPYQGQPYPNQPYSGQQYGGQLPPDHPARRDMEEKDDFDYDDPLNRKKHSSRGGSGKKRSKKKRRKSFFGSFLGRMLVTLFIVFLILFGAYSCTAVSLIRKVEHVDMGARTRRTDALAKGYVTNVLLVGTDGRTATERGRSDTMMLASINSRTNKVSLISIMRDCYVEIPNYGWDKLNAAYSYGGPELLMDTIENNFGIAVDDYIAVNFVSFANIVDCIGGIDIDVSDAEAQEINTILQAEVNNIMGDDTFADLLTGGGRLHLNGKQALSYSRIRYIGNADFERTERQREVMELVMNRFKHLKPTAFPQLSANVLPGVSTNMTTSEMYFFSLKVPFMLGYDRQQIQIPAEGTYYGDSTPSGDALIVDFNKNFDVICNNAY